MDNIRTSWDNMDNMEYEEAPGKNGNVSLVEKILTSYFDIFPPQSGSNGRPGESSPVEENLMESDTKTNTNGSKQVIVFDLEMKDEDIESNQDSEVDNMSRLINARIKYTFEGEDESTENIVFWMIKIPSKCPIYREIANKYGLYKREVSFYVEILPAMKYWVQNQLPDSNLEFSVPNCFYATFSRYADLTPDPNIIDHIYEAESVLVLQDLRAFEFGKRHLGEGMSATEALAAINEITKFHAVSYAMQAKEWTLNFTGLFSNQGLFNLYAALFKRGVPLFYQFLKDCTSSDVTDADRTRIFKAVRYLDKNMKDILPKLLVSPKGDPFPTTLIHLDLWSDNLLFHIKDEDRDNNVPPEEQDLDCVIIDWQMVSCGKPTHDIAILILASMDAQARRENTAHLLQYYYMKFQKMISLFGLRMPYNFEDLVRNFKSSCILAIIMAISSMDLIRENETAQTRLLLGLKDLVDDGTFSSLLGAFFPPSSAPSTTGSSSPPPRSYPPASYIT